MIPKGRLYNDTSENRPAPYDNNNDHDKNYIDDINDTNDNKNNDDIIT